MSDIAAELLDVLRRQLSDAVDFAERPTELGGGFFTSNHRFSLSGAPPEWSGPLVLRLFPTHAPDGLDEWEAAVQTFVTERLLPAPGVLLRGDDEMIDGRRWFVMEFLAGEPAMGDLEVGTVLRRARWLITRLPVITADTHLRLHALDPAPLLDRFGPERAGVERWFATVADSVDAGAEGLAPVLDWLIANRPAPRAELVLCHGDSWGGNLLVGNEGALTGLIDWSVATVAEPALEVGFLTMALGLAPVPMPRLVQRFVQRMARRLSRSYETTYRAGSSADLRSIPYYESLRCLFELAAVVRYRNAVSSGDDYGSPRPSWDHVGDQMVTYLAERTGVTANIPPAVH